MNMHMRRPRMGGALAIASLVLAACQATATQGGVREGQILNANVALSKLRTVILRGPEGQPLQGAATVRVNGRIYPVQDGVLSLPEAVWTEAGQGQGLIVTAAGYAPVQVAVGKQGEAIAEGAVSLGGGATASGGGASANGTASGTGLSIQLTELRERSLPVNLGLGGGVATLPSGAMTLSFPPGLVHREQTGVVASSYTPVIGPEVAQRQSTELASLAAAVQALGGQASAGAGGCTAPFGCAAPEKALGVNLLVDGPISPEGGSLQASVDLMVLTRGWNGQGTPPWTQQPGAWTPAQIADAQAALQILAAFQAMNAAGPAWAQAMRDTHGLVLNGQILTFQVPLAGGSLSTDGTSRVQVAGLAVLGVNLEVSVTSAVGEALPPALLQGTQLVSQVGALPVGTLGGGSVGTTLVTGGQGQVVPPSPGGSSPSGLAGGGGVGGTGLPPLPSVNLLPSQVVTNGVQLIANHGGGLLSNNGSTLLAGSQLLSDQGSTLISNNSGAIAGVAYMPMRPPFAAYRLLQFGTGGGLPTVRTTPGGVQEYLWSENSILVRAVSATGTALTDWSATDGSGRYLLRFAGKTPAAFFIEVEGMQGMARSRAIAFAPGKNTTWVEVNSASTVLAHTTNFLEQFLPPEISGVAGAQSGINAPKSGYSGASLEAANAYCDARIAELQGSLDAMNLALYQGDIFRTQGAQSQASALAVMRMTDRRQVYDHAYGGAFPFTSVQMVNPITTIPGPGR